METVSNLASAASRAIWGEGDETTGASHEEPVSGQQGAGTASEPFDKGNEEKNSDNTEKSKQKPELKPSEATSSDPDAKLNAGEAGMKGQPGKPEMPHTDTEREELVRKGKFPHNPNDHSGEPLRMHDGSENQGDDKAEKKDRSASVAQEGGAPHGSAKGTGEEYVKSTGTAADGGDFDATNPGAGLEATRLLEQKGVHRQKANGAEDSTDDVASKDSEKTKASKMAKIKEKLHIGRNKA